MAILAMIGFMISADLALFEWGSPRLSGIRFR